MAAKPADFFIGVVDLFSIFLPGALLAYLCFALAQTTIADKRLPFVENAAADWIIFILAAYLFGHFASLVGSILDPVYDKTYLIYKQRDGDLLYRHAANLQAEMLGPDANIANSFQWARTNVRLLSAAGAREIDRLEADSKFCRSVTVVLGAFALVSAVKGFAWWVQGGSVLLMALGCYRFFDLRWKLTQAACLCFVVLQAGDKGVPEAPGDAVSTRDASSNGEAAGREDEEPA
jgi:hypothetical protein